MLVGAAALLGCNEPAKRVNAEPHGGDPEQAAPGAEAYRNMTDNALLADMCVCDMHFLPHRATLSRLGIDRVTRLAAMIQAYGGQIRFSTDESDEALNTERAKAIVEFLNEAGLTHADTLVVRDMPGGAGMRATEATAILAEHGSYQPGSAGKSGAKPANDTTIGGKPTTP